ncbi:MAG: long-chain fatty acid--CoA ligase [Caulobacteraceae bacterium]|nr:long-chain fatty acid--CoA ligase [Caulobacteraceae bacterium]
MEDGNRSQSIAERVGEVLQLSPQSGAVEFQGAWTSWSELAQAAAAVEAELARLGIAKDAPIGWVARNRPASVAGFVALLRAGRPIAPLRPNQAPQGFCEEIRGQRLKAIVSNGDDWEISGVVEAARDAGSAGVRIDEAAPGFRVAGVPGLSAVGAGPHRADAPGLVVERLSSGTTGAPKRIPVYADKVLPTLQQTEETQSASAGEPLRLKTSPAIILSPFTHAGGIFGLLMAMYQARPIILFDKFDVGRWVEAVQTYRPKSASLVPAMVRMVLDSDTPKEALASLRAVRSSTAALDPDVQAAFEARFGVPILIDFGAAEFLGGVAGWSLPEYQKYGESKRGSVGRARPDIQLRIVDLETKAPQAAGEVGQLEIFSTRFSPDWIRTNDLARIDEDGFVYIHGRVDDAINRGGFKILPDEIAPIIRQYPGVRDATVVGFPDDRLGQVPVAVIEAPGASLDPEGIRAFLKERLAPYQVPVDYKFVDALPRTNTLKISRPELKAMLGLS